MLCFPNPTLTPDINRTYDLIFKKFYRLILINLSHCTFPEFKIRIRLSTMFIYKARNSENFH